MYNFCRYQSTPVGMAIVILFLLLRNIEAAFVKFTVPSEPNSVLSSELGYMKM